MPILEGSSYATFVVRLSQPSDQDISVDWFTEAKTAVPGTDYEETSGTLLFLPGQTEKTIQVLVYGRAPGDTEARTFTVRVLPAPGVVIGPQAGDCVITVTDEHDVVVTTVTMAKGREGLDNYQLAKLQGFEGTLAEYLASLKGEPGDGGPSVELRVSGGNIQWRVVGADDWIDLIELSLLEGPAGDDGDDGREIELRTTDTHIQWRYETDSEWMNLIALEDIEGADGDNGREVELRANATHIQWRYDGDAEWENLVALEDLEGADGDDGREVELQSNATHIQWRYEGDAEWADLVPLSELKGDAGDDGEEVEMRATETHVQWRLGEGSWFNLIPLSEITGPAGTGLNNRGAWVTNTTYEPNDFVFSEGSEAASSMWILADAAPYLSEDPPHEDLAHWIEFAAPAGADGHEVELRTTETHIQWRHEGEAEWANLIALSELKGDDGAATEMQITATHIQWRVVGGEWANLIALEDLEGADGDDGREIELGASETHIRWRYDGDSEWTNLVALEDLDGADGTNGSVWRWGSTAPDDGAGNDGDLYLRLIADNPANGNVYQRVDGAYGSPIGNIQGPPGEGGGGGGSNDIISLLSANVSNQTLTLASVATCTIQPSTWYRVQGRFIMRPASTALEHRWGLLGTFGDTMCQMKWRFRTLDGPTEYATHGKSDTVTFESTEVATPGSLLELEGMILTSGSGGNVQVGFSATTANDWLEVLAGSFLILTPIETQAP